MNTKIIKSKVLIALFATVFSTLAIASTSGSGTVNDGGQRKFSWACSAMDSYPNQIWGAHSWCSMQSNNGTVFSATMAGRFSGGYTRCSNGGAANYNFTLPSYLPSNNSTARISSDLYYNTAHYYHSANVQGLYWWQWYNGENLHHKPTASTYSNTGGC